MNMILLAYKSYVSGPAFPQSVRLMFLFGIDCIWLLIHFFRDLKRDLQARTETKFCCKIMLTKQLFNQILCITSSQGSNSGKVFVMKSNDMLVW